MSEPYRILLVDDDPRLLRLLRAVLRKHQIHPTTNPAQAAMLAKQHDVDVVLSGQNMSEKSGVDVLREIREIHPRAMRLLLGGRADFRAAVRAVNECEVYRFITQPWNNEKLFQWVTEAGSAAREVPPIPYERLAENQHNQACGQVGVLVIEQNPGVQQRLREILQAHYKVHFAANSEYALRAMQQQEFGVIISGTQAGRGDLIAVLKAIKQQHPHIVLVLSSEPDEGGSVIELINEGQIYRVLPQPIRMGSCRLSVDSAIDRYWRLKQNPRAVRRVKAAESPERGPHSPQQLSPELLKRIRSLPGLTLSSAHL